MTVQKRQVWIQTGREDIVEEKPYPDAAIRCAQQFAVEEAAGEVPFHQEVLSIDRLVCLLDETKTRPQGIQPIHQTDEPGLVGATFVEHRNGLAQASRVAWRNRVTVLPRKIERHGPAAGQ